MSTRVWLDPWIPGTQSRRIISPRGTASETMVVADLFLADGSGWDAHKVRNLFLPFEQVRIFNIFISNAKPTDCWCWDLEKNGVYSVRTAYRLIMGDTEGRDNPSSSRSEPWMWNKIWKVPLLPRIKIFFWQFCNEALPTKYGLHSRVGNGGAFCQVCGSRKETELHMARDCWVAQEVWEGLGVDTKDEMNFRGLRDWVSAVWEDLDGGECKMFMITCWALWEGRNKFVFEGTRPDPCSIIGRVRSLLAETEDELVVSGAVEVMSRWEPPPMDIVKVNVDAGVIEGVGVGMGAICREADGNVAWCVAVQRREIWEPREAEAFAVLVGLREALLSGRRKVIVESDCLAVINALSRKEQGRSTFHLVLDDIFVLCNSFDYLSWSYVNRKFNKVAHALAHFQPWNSGRRVWSNVCPPNIAAAVASDLLAIND